MERMTFRVIAKIHTDFPEKFGIPRQSGVAKSLKGRVIFEPEYRDPASVKGLEGFSHLWVLWVFSKNKKEDWSALVRPPRLGGNRRVGVFATRSPYRPNPIGLSAVKLDKIWFDSKYGPVLEVSGVDMADGTPILDVKPYLAYADSYSSAIGGFSDKVTYQKLGVVFPQEIVAELPKEIRTTLCEVLAEDPRPHYQNDPNRVYGFSFAGYEIQFRVSENTVKVLSVKR